MTHDHSNSPSPRTVALDSLHAGIDAAQPREVVRRTLSRDGSMLTVADETFDLDDFSHVVVLGGGNAAGEMAVSLESVLGEHLTDGIVVTDTPAETVRIEVRPGDHPLPTERNRDATRDILNAACDVDEETLVLAPISGGGSALLSAPADGISLDSFRTVTDGLLRSGADIHDINIVRRALSSIKDGGLARAASPARVVGLVVSDVIGDDPSVVASGPTYPGRATPEDARATLRDFLDAVPEDIETALDDREMTAAGPDEADAFAHVTNHVIADNWTALDAAANRAREHGYTPLILSSRIGGEASDVGRTHAAIGVECLATGNPLDPPAVLLSGGETTVTVDGDGVGGPNQEFVLAATQEMDRPGIVIASIDTDGLDGSTDAAGALVDHETVPTEEQAAARAALRNHDVYPFLDDRNALVETGETGTNVNDLRAVAVRRANGDEPFTDESEQT
jgi:glycerate 2-kinase